MLYNLNFSVLLLEILFFITGFLIFLIDRFIPNKNYAFFLTILALIGGFFSLLFTPFGEFTMAFKTDFYATTLKFLILSGFIFIVFVLYSYLQNFKAQSFGEIYGFLLFSMLGAFIMLSSQDFLSLFLGMELMSIPIYFSIASGYVYRKNSLEGALKYFIAGSISSLFFLLSIGVIYYKTGSLYLKDVFIDLAQQLHKKELFLALIFLLSSFSIKLSMVPFHMWAPDAYEAAPLPITAFLAGLIKFALFGTFIKILILAFSPLRLDFGQILIPISLLTILIGALMAIKQDDIVRMLAYSSISHVGYASLGLVSGDFISYGFSIFYLFIYLFMTIGVFTLLIYLASNKQEFLKIPNLSGLSKDFVFISFFVLLFFFSLAGVPPTAGFMAKFYIFISLIKANYLVVALFALLFSVIGAYPYLRVLKVLYMDKSISSFERRKYGFTFLLPLMISAFVIIFLGVYPKPVVDFIQRTLFLYLSLLYLHP